MAIIDLGKSKRVRARPWEVVVETDVNGPPPPLPKSREITPEENEARLQSAPPPPKRVRSRPWEIVVEEDLNRSTVKTHHKPLEAPVPHRLDLPESSSEAFRMGYEEALRDIEKRLREDG